MRTRLLMAFVSAVFLVGAAVYLGSLAVATTGAADRAVRPAEPAASPAPGGTADKLPADPVRSPNCSQCVSSFCPVSRVRCSFTGTCSGGKSGCCEYTCACDDTCTTVSTPSNACSFNVPDCPDPNSCVGIICTTTWCKFEDFECTLTNCAGGCCNYACQNAPCHVTGGCPPNACPGSCN